MRVEHEMADKIDQFKELVENNQDELQEKVRCA